MPKEFGGKVVVISGGSRGIGRGIALAFAREGAQTVLAAANAATLAEGAKVVAAAGGPAPITIAGDLRTPVIVRAAIANGVQVLDIEPRTARRWLAGYRAEGAGVGAVRSCW